MMSPISATVLNTLTPNKYIINLYIYFIHLSLGILYRIHVWGGEGWWNFSHEKLCYAALLGMT